MRLRRPKVVYWNNQPTPYVVDRFNAVVDRDEVDLEVWFDRERESDRSWVVDPATWRFEARFLGRHDATSVRDRIPLDRLRSTRPDVLIANYDRAHMALGLLAARRYARRTAIRCLPTWPAWVPPVPQQELAKHVLFRTVDGAKVPGPDGAAYAIRYGLPADRVWTVTQSVDVDHFATARVVRDAQGEPRSAGCTFLYVGRIWSGKGLDDLIAAYRWVRRQEPAVRLVLAGDGPDESRLRHATRELPDVEWRGFAQPAQLPGVYAAADVLVFPTLGDPNGLVVEEAMAAGLPVLSTSAAGDIRSRVLEGETGFVVPPGSPARLAERMLELARQPALRRSLAARASASVDHVRPAAYAADFVAFVEGLLARPPRRNVLTGLTPALAALSASRPHGRGQGAIR